MTEQQLQDLILEAAQVYGWKRVHPRRANVTRKDGTVRHMTATQGDTGYVDVTLARGGRHMFLELKSETGQVKAEQVEWLNELANTGTYTIDDWRSRDRVPDGRARIGNSWVLLDESGDYWSSLVAVVRPRHKDWILERLK